MIHPVFTQDFPEGVFAAKLTGVQTVVPNKRPGEAARDVYMQMAIVRIKTYQCDVLLTLNTELASLKLSEDTPMADGAPSLLAGVDPTSESAIQECFAQIVASFRHTTLAEVAKLFDQL